MSGKTDSADRTGLEVAVIGIAARFPGAETTKEFWRNLHDGVESVTFFTDDELAASGIDRDVINDSRFVKARAVRKDIDLFDASFFGYSPREAEIIDPQQRHFLECAWQALEDAGYVSEAYPGRIGVYAGSGATAYYLNNLLPNRDICKSLGLSLLSNASEKDYLPMRVSYKLNLSGPSVCIQTTCSTSLVAVHMACQALLSGDCEIALAGGVTIVAQAVSGYFYEEGGILSPDGHCRAFDAKAAGIVPGNGVGVVVLKKLQDAINDGDYIHAIIRGSAINNDGSLKVSFTAPSVERQMQVIRDAQVAAEVGPETITYIETHGTGTILGDPIELAGLTAAFRLGTTKKNFCAIGSVKTNIGHLDTAAGIAGFIKTVLALERKMIPPSLHFENPNPNIDFESSPFYVNTKLTEWKSNGIPRRAGVSSFGMGGANAHVILEEAPRPTPSGPSRPNQLLMLSAKSAAALGRMTKNLADYLKQHEDSNLADVAYTLQVGRQAFSHRRMLMCSGREDATAALEEAGSQRVITSCVDSSGKPVAFMFPGQGAQYVNMGLDLYRQETTFRDQIDHCSEFLIPHLQLDLRQILYPGSEYHEYVRWQLTQTSIAQAALFVVEFSLAKLWISWGIKPQAMIGHSIGEYVAACLAGVFTLEEALALVAARGKLMQNLAGGAMLAVPLPEPEVEGLIENELSLAAINAPSLCVVSGPLQAVEALEARLDQEGVSGRRLHTSHAFHSRMMDPILDAFTNLVKGVSLKPPKIPYISNVTGRWVTESETIDTSYWARHLRQTVRFADGMCELLKESKMILLEVGPGKTLSNLAKRLPNKGAVLKVISSLPSHEDRNSDVESVIEALGQLWVAGRDVDWTGFYVREQRRRLPLPTYSFDRKRYWIEAPKKFKQAKISQTEVENTSTAQTKERGIEDWFYTSSWRESVLPLQPEAQSNRSSCLVFADKLGLGRLIGEQLEKNGDTVISVEIGGRFTKLGENLYSIDPVSLDDYISLLQELRGMEKIPRKILHMWSVTPAGDMRSGAYDFGEFQDSGFYSLLLLVKALQSVRAVGPLKLGVVSSNMQKLAGDTESHPSKATLLGFCKVIPQEYRNIDCCSIDIDWSEIEGGWRAELIENLIAELRLGVPDKIIAYRERRRWAQSFERVRLCQEDQYGTGLRSGGVYIITGGLSSLGLEIAEYLASKEQTRLVLIDRFGLPANAMWNQLVVGGDDVNAEPELRDSLVPVNTEKRVDLDMGAEEECITQWEGKIERENGIKRGDGRYELEEMANKLCSSYIINYLASNNIDISKGKVYGEQELATASSITTKYKKLFDFMVRTLEEDNIVKRYGGKVEFLVGRDQIEAPSILREKLDEAHPECKGVFDLLQHCVDNYGRALSGEIEAISVLYPDGAHSLLRNIDQNVITYNDCGTYLRLSREVISKIVKRSSGDKIRILEIGGGNGSLTRSIIPGIINENVEYFFTDIGKSFVIRAEREATNRGIGFMSFGVFDISKDPVAQGYREQSIDIIVGLDVVHATRSIEETISNLKKLLSPNGVLILLETVGKLPRWETMIWGLAEGWWYFEDSDLRRESPLLSLDLWEEVLRKHGFRNAKGYPRDAKKRLNPDHGLIVAQQADGIANRQRSEVELANLQLQQFRKLWRIKELGSEILIVKADVSDYEQMRVAVDRTHRRFGEVNGVIHMGGSSGGQAMAAEMAQKEFRSKVTGAQVLDDLLKYTKLDFFVLCSFTASATVQVKQAICCAANAFLDAYAHSKPSRDGRRTISINWDQEREFKEAGAAEGGITIDKALEAFGRILSSYKMPQVIISTNSLAAMTASQSNVFMPALTEAIQKAQGEKDGLKNIRIAANKHSRPELKNDYVAPRNELEQRIAFIWQDLFNIDQLGIHDNFFDLGGDSLMALSLNAKLYKAFQAKLQPHILLKTPTVAGLAKLIEVSRTNRDYSCEAIERALPPRLVEFQRGNSDRTLFLVHPGGGGVFGYRDLAQSLGSDISVYGIQARGLESQEEPFNRIEEMAAHYLDAVRFVQPQGPYLLGGLSFGGVAAFEMAQQLLAVGEKVGLLALFDAPGPNQIVERWNEDSELLAILANKSALLEPDEFHRLGLDLRVRDSLKDVKTINKGVIDQLPEQTQQLVRVWKMNAEALHNYQLRQYPGRIVFFRARERSSWLPLHPELPWIEVAEEGVNVQIASGGHGSMLAPPHVQRLADILRRYWLN
jgi:acyl transferase domain-containing protein/thioesterase domain-containing protein/SAM-dependent methyltransferase/acyl carrier protein